MYVRDGASWWTSSREEVGGDKDVSGCWVAPLLSQGETEEEQGRAHQWVAGYQHLELRGEAGSTF